MLHTKTITRQHPAQATSLLEWQQKGVVLGAFATGINTLSSAFNTLSQIQDRKSPED